MSGMEKNGREKIDLLILNAILILCILFVLSWPCFWYFSDTSDALSVATIWFLSSCTLTGSHVALYQYLKKKRILVFKKYRWRLYLANVIYLSINIWFHYCPVKVDK